MDNLTKNLEAYIDSFVAQIVDSVKDVDANKVRTYLYEVVAETTINNMNEEQLNNIKANLNDQEKLMGLIEDYSSDIPGLTGIIESNLVESVEKVKADPKLVS